jgi:prophage antirepressor-like protein
VNNIEIFENPEFGKVRTIVIDDEPWFVGKDVAEILGYSQPSVAISKKVDDDDKGISKMETPGGEQNTIIVNESGLYSLILSSKLPTARKFKHWVTSEVLPSIRKTGSYNLPDFNNPAEAARAWANEYEAKQKLLTENKVMKPKAEYFDCLVDRNLLTNFRTTAKEFHMKQKQFINWLLKSKFVYRDQKGSLQPYSEYADYFHVKDVKSTAGNNWAGTQTLITPKGKEAFRLMLGK